MGVHYGVAHHSHTGHAAETHVAQAGIRADLGHQVGGEDQPQAAHHEDQHEEN